MSGSEEFSSPDIVEGASPSRAPAALHRQNADVSPSDIKTVCVDLGVKHATGGGRLHKLGFQSHGTDAAPQIKDQAVCDTTPRVEWTKFFSDVWTTTRNNDVVHECQHLDISSDMSGDDAGILVERPSQRRGPVSASRALGTASIERKYAKPVHASPTFKTQQNSLLVTKLRISTSDNEAATPETISAAKTTPDFVDPRLILRRKMMMRPSLAKKLAETDVKISEEEKMTKQLENEKAAAKAEQIKAKNELILSVRRQMMMRPSKVKQIAEMESNLRTLQAEIDKIKNEKNELVEAAKKAENARRLAVRRQMMQRPGKPIPVEGKTCVEKAKAPKMSNIDASESSLDELLQQFSVGLKSGIFKADSLIAQLEPARHRGIYQSPVFRSNFERKDVAQAPNV